MINDYKTSSDRLLKTLNKQKRITNYIYIGVGLVVMIATCWGILVITSLLTGIDVAGAINKGMSHPDHSKSPYHGGISQNLNVKQVIKEATD